VQLSALNETIDAEIIDPQEIGGFVQGIGKPLRFGSGRLRWRRSMPIHAVNADSIEKP
jgi:hypothetical protein